MPNLPPSKPRVVLTHWVHPEVLEFLSTFSDPLANETRESLPDEELMRRCGEAEGLMVFMPDRIDEAFLDRCPQLRVISAALKGYDNFDVAACQRRGIHFSYVPDLLTVPTAELAVGLTIALARNLVPGDELIRSGRFAGWRPVMYGMGLSGATVGLVGYGAVGRAFARCLSGFGCRLLAYDRVALAPEAVAGMDIEPSGLEELLAESDIVALFLPLSSETRGLAGRDFLSKMKHGALLVNVCRGSVVDEEAVADALESGDLGGYAADVFEMEDWALSDRPRSIAPRLLRNRARTVFTPHLGSAVDEVRKKISWEAAENLKSYFESVESNRR